MVIGPRTLSSDGVVHALVGGRLGEYLECAGTTPLVLLGVSRACSGQRRGCVQTSIVPLGSINAQRWLGYPHLMSSDVENESVS